MKKMNLTGSGGRWLVFSNGVLGHTLYALPALQALKDMYPGAYVNLIADNASAELVAASSLVDKVTIFDRKKDSFWRQLEIVKMLRRDKYDVSIHFRSGVRNEQLAFLGGVKERYGNKLKGSLQFVNHICSDVSDVHVLKKRENFIRQVLGTDVILSPPSMHHDPEGTAEAEKALRVNGLEVGKFVVLHPAGKTFGGMKWSLEHWAGVVEKVAKHTPVVVVCADFERDEVSSAVNGDNVFHLSGSVGFLSELIYRCGWFLGNDSAPAHLADAWKRPRVLIYPDGDKEYTKWSPLYLENCTVIRKYEFMDQGLDEPLEWLFAQC
ncbi:glycosyltransferase family 9 protein [Maridesulfovibrio sp. FT414]|uniref:glycosyltransferase family 9 protein n=1 Tax=Maridesulfovibrio sp. FT414 TaxID=2979469 RepID=UPI003D8077EE